MMGKSHVSSEFTMPQRSLVVLIVVVGRVACIASCIRRAKMPQHIGFNESWFAMVCCPQVPLTLVIPESDPTMIGL